ncbi:hypothetical protein GF373_11650 [bacterium]|nr:hypothetical protein [bacterium]
MKKHIFIALGILFIGFCVWFLTAYVFITDTQRVHRVIESCRRSVEKGSILQFSNQLAPKYEDASGTDKATVLRFLFDFFQETENRSIRITQLDLVMKDTQAQAMIEFILRVDKPSSLANLSRSYSQDPLKPIRIHVWFAKIDNRWKITKTQRSHGRQFRR